MQYREERYVNHLGRKHQIVRMMWIIVWSVGARWLPRSIGSGWKRYILRMFGAKISSTAVVYSSVKIYYPKNLVMMDDSCLAQDVDCYNVDVVTIGRHATVSQGAMLCTATHDISSASNKLVTRPIVISDGVWIGARAFVGPGVTVGEGAVVGACGVVFKNVESYNVVVGNPAETIKKRVITRE